MTPHYETEVVSSLMPPSAHSLRSSDELERTRAWRRLYDSEFQRAYRLILRSGVDPSDAEDLAQRAFVIVHRRLSEGDNVCNVGAVRNVGAWVRGIVLKVVSEHYRWRKVRRLKNWLLPDVAGTSPGEVPNPESEAASLQQRARIAEVLGGMSHKLRDVLVLTEIEGLGPQEAAEVLGCPTNTVRSRRRLALEDFRRRWRATAKEAFDVDG